MGNIQKDVKLVAFRGQLYRGMREAIFDGNVYAYGDGEYFSTHYGDASSYAKADPLNNRDIGPTAARMAVDLNISYLEARGNITKNGDGKVMTAFIDSKRMITFGGGKFMDIDSPYFKERFDYAMVLSDIPSDARLFILNYVINNNETPEKVSSKLTDNGLGVILNHYAHLCDCDAFRLSSDIVYSGGAPDGVICEHIIVLDKSRCKLLRWDDPIAMGVLDFALAKNRSSYLVQCEDKRQEIFKDVEPDIAYYLDLIRRGEGLFRSEVDSFSSVRDQWLWLISFH